MFTAVLIVALVATTALTIKFAVSEGLVRRGKIGGGIESRSAKGKRVTFHRFRK